MKVGSVPYLNAKPLVAGLSPDEVIFEVPSRLPQILAIGEVAAILVSSIEALRTPHCSVVSSIGIACEGPVESVRLFLRTPLDEVKRVALDHASMTSSALTQIFFEGRDVQFVTPPEHVEELADFDAALLIGDRGMSSLPGSISTIDLGEWWRSETGLPFVWALWMGGPELTPEIAARLQESCSTGLANLGEIAQSCAQGAGVSEVRALHYLSEVMQFQLTDRHLEGLREYERRLMRLGLLSQPSHVYWVDGIATVPQ